MHPLKRRLAAEFFGTFWLVLGGCGAAVLGGNYLGVAIAFGLTVLTMVYAVGHISGGHFNPAITLGFVATQRIRMRLALIYWLMQFAGAVAASLLLWWIFPKEAIAPARLGAPLLHPSVGSGAGMALEAIMTFFLVLVVFATAVDERGAFRAVAGFGIGLVVTMDILTGGPLTGAAINPARAFGPQLVYNVWESYTWIFYVGPFAGGVIAALLYEYLFLRRPIEAPGREETGLIEPGVAE
jgi:aquaporin Z